MFVMSHPAYIREKAREMRTERNLSIDEIAERLALPRTTVFYRLRDLPIDRSARPQSLAQLNGSIAMQAKYRRLREAAYEEGRANFDELARDPSFRDFVCLYLAEGYKRNRNVVSVCNSDPTVVVLCNRWIRRLPVLGRAARHPTRTSADAAQIQQQPTRRADLAVRPRRARSPCRRHDAPSEARRLDGPAPRVLALDCALRGVAQSGSAPRLGRGGHRFKSGRPDLRLAPRPARGYPSRHPSERSSPALHNR
jgi:hypothetical protein